MSPTMDHNFPTKITVPKLNPRHRLIQPVSAISSEASISIRLALSFHPPLARQNTREQRKTSPPLQRQMLGNETSSTSCPPEETPQASLMTLQAQAALRLSSPRSLQSSNTNKEYAGSLAVSITAPHVQWEPTQNGGLAWPSLSKQRDIHSSIRERT